MDTVFSVRMLPSRDTLDDPGWLAAARTGEAWALEQFFHSYQSQVYALCHRLVGRCEDAEDATQTTFVRAFRDLSRFRGDSSVKTWLYRIAVNEAYTVLRKRRDTSELTEDAAIAGDAGRSVAERLAVRQALARTTADHRVVLVLRFWEDLSYEEIATVLGVSLPAVKMRLKRARDEFRKYYEVDL